MGFTTNYPSDLEFSMAKCYRGTLNAKFVETDNNVRMDIVNVMLALDTAQIANRRRREGTYPSRVLQNKIG